MVNHADSEVEAAAPRRRSMKLKGLGVALTASAFLTISAIPAWAADLMTVTFIRHAQSQGNYSGLIDTQTPGPVLTDGTQPSHVVGGVTITDNNGQQQARDIVKVLGDNNYDSVYASQMVRTQLTAAPMSQYLGLPIDVLPGLQEIEAGYFENGGERDPQAGLGYISKPLNWVGMKITGASPTGVPIFTEVPKDLTQAIPPGPGPWPGPTQPISVNGTQFDTRVDNALRQIYNNGDRTPVVFSHGGTIMFWTMMNAENLTFADKVELFTKYQLNNTNYVVVEGDPVSGHWNLLNWNGKQYSPEKTYLSVLRTQIGTLNGQLADAWKQVANSLNSGDFTTIATAINRSMADVKFAYTKFNRAMNAQNIKEINKIVNTVKGWFTPAPAPAPTAAAPVSVAAAPASSMLKQLDAPVAAPQSVDTGDSAKAPVASKADEPKVEAVKAGDTKAEGAKASKSAKADKAKKTVRRAPQKAAAHASAGGEG